MKTLKFLASMMLFVLLLSIIGCNSGSSKNKEVCAKWSTGWYEATITSETADKYHVVYYDKVEADLPKDEVRFPLKKEEIKVNDRVLAVWTSGTYYPGTVVELKEDGAMVQWDDGSSVSLAKYGKIAKGDPKPVVETKMTFETSTGKRVCAKWGESWYDAKVVSSNGDKTHVIYYDNVEYDVSTATDIKELIKGKEDLKVNDKVYAIWTSGKFYPGKVQSISNDGAMV
jgi:hypothetical protein